MAINIDRTNSIARTVELLGYRLGAVEHALSDSQIGSPGTEYEDLIDHTMMEVDDTIRTLAAMGAYLQTLPGTWIDDPMVVPKSQ